MSENPREREFATFGGGCFWCLEAVFEQLIGVESVFSGYSGGAIENPTYRQICTGTTGHAEVVRVVFDTQKISYSQLLEIFFVIHDPTTFNRQGNDAGTQYRSVIYTHSAVQQGQAEALIARLSAEGVWDASIVTEVLPAPDFYGAEDYHQHYFARNPEQGYCQVVIAPKLAKFRQHFKTHLRASSELSSEEN